MIPFPDFSVFFMFFEMVLSPFDIDDLAGHFYESFDEFGVVAWYFLASEFLIGEVSMYDSFLLIDEWFCHLLLRVVFEDDWSGHSRARWITSLCAIFMILYFTDILRLIFLDWYTHFAIDIWDWFWQQGMHSFCSFHDKLGFGREWICRICCRVNNWQG